MPKSSFRLETPPIAILAALIQVPSIGVHRFSLGATCSSRYTVHRRLPVPDLIGLTRRSRKKGGTTTQVAECGCESETVHRGIKTLAGSTSQEPSSSSRRRRSRSRARRYVVGGSSTLVGGGTGLRTLLDGDLRLPRIGLRDGILRNPNPRIRARPTRKTA